MYQCFVRNWYLPNGEPDYQAHKTMHDTFPTEEEARAWCQEYNRNNKPGKLSRKAEYMEV